MLRANIVTTDNGLLPHPIHYAQVEPSKYPVSCQELRDNGYHEVRYEWLHIPTGKNGISTLWVPVYRWAGLLVIFWNQCGGFVWKYSLALQKSCDTQPSLVCVKNHKLGVNRMEINDERC